MRSPISSTRRIVIVGSGPLSLAVEARCRSAGSDVLRIPAVPGEPADFASFRSAGVGAHTRLAVLTDDDKVNFVAAVFAKEALGVCEVVARIEDPANEKAFREFDIAVINTLELVTDAVLATLVA